MSPAYLRHVAAATFGGPLRYAVRQKIIAENPMRHVELPPDVVDLDNDLPHLPYSDIEALADYLSGL